MKGSAPSAGREHFGSSFTFIMAMAGSAIGLGNIWRFPYIVGEHGGAAFLVAYLICSIFISLPCFMCESLIGRRGRSGAHGAMKKLAPGSFWPVLMIVPVFGCFVVVSYYCVVGGWSLDYLVRAIAGGIAQGNPEDATAVFSRMAASPVEAIAMDFAFLGATALIVLLGVKNGIEKFTKITMPLLFVLMVAMVVFSVSLPGSGEGVKYLLHPDFSKLDASGWACALGQSFYSMSLGVGTVLVYSSFMKKEDNILRSGFWTSISDSAFALIAGFAIMPAVFAAGLEPGAGPALVYETLPYIFSKIGLESPVLGYVVALVFFLAILMAALTSSISLFEVCVENAMERWGLKRRWSVLLYLFAAAALGVPCALSFGPMAGTKLFGLNIFDLCDYVSSNFFMTLGALAFTIFVGWRMKKADIRSEFTNDGALGFNAKVFNFFYFLVRWIIPPVILIIFIANII